MALTGGDKLAARLRDLSKRVSSGASVQVGFLEGSTYPDGTSTAMVAAINEYGAPSRGQPPRPFFRSMIADKSGSWGDGVEAALKATDLDAEKALALVGEGIKGQLQDSIRDLQAPPLSPTTVKKKGFAKPLIDTSHMLNSVDYVVTKKGA